MAVYAALWRWSERAADAQEAGRGDAIVADVGGTTTDLGVLVDGFARESAAGCVIGGVQTNLSMPDVLSIAYGGGTFVHDTRTGPDSVDRAITTRALVFGGDTPTLSDAAALAGRIALGDRDRIAGHLETRFGARPKTSLEDFDTELAHAVSLVSHGRRHQPVIAVGGAAGLIPDTVGGLPSNGPATPTSPTRSARPSPSSAASTRPSSRPAPAAGKPSRRPARRPSSERSRGARTPTTSPSSASTRSLSATAAAG
ncbi:hydantoinase/oxoprolinase family protein [Streptomyces vastus]|uniref:Hydantoinase A/oxoprolinase domain-containing protein n=1 Tax=Streptomyces vastus TaxID=285451 RepID=A0ABP6DDD5_9ACTN